jgi:Rod binding domain-containing protein
MLSIGSTDFGSLPADSAGSTQPKLAKAAHEFEAQMMNELLKPLTASGGLTGDEDAGLGSAGALGGFASEALGRALSEHGGLGIAGSVVRSLSHAGNKARSEVIGNPEQK